MDTPRWFAAPARAARTGRTVGAVGLVVVLGLAVMSCGGDDTGGAGGTGGTGGAVVSDGASAAGDRPQASPAPTGSKGELGSPGAQSSGSVQPDRPAPALTVRNSAEFKNLLELEDNCSGQVARFAKKYVGRTIDFTGAIVAMAAHGSIGNRFDILVSPGAYDSDSARGPSFQFADVDLVFDMRVEGESRLGRVGVGDEFGFIAKVKAFDQDTCLFQLKAVRTIAS